MSQPSPLLGVAEEFHPLVLVADRDAVSNALLGWAGAGLVVRTIRGRKARTLKALFDEFAAALQFPLYFGENGPAFDECLSDLDWLPPQAGFVVLVVEPEQVLADADSATMSWLVGSLRRAAREWSTPIQSGEWWDRPAVPFHVVLGAGPETEEAARRRWTDAGAALAPFPS